jgi:hypothetical protein
MSRKTTINYDCWWAPVLAEDRDHLNTSAFGTFVSAGSEARLFEEDSPDS